MMELLIKNDKFRRHARKDLFARLDPGGQVEMMRNLYQNDELCIQNDELCIQNDELCIQNDGWLRPGGQLSLVGIRCDFVSRK